MKSSLLTVENGFYAVIFVAEGGSTVTAYYSLGRLVAVQIVKLVYVSENYWLDASKKHIHMIKNTADKTLVIREVAIDVLEGQLKFALGAIAS